MSNQRNDGSPPFGGSNWNFGLVVTGFFAIVGSIPILAGNSARPWAIFVAASFLLTTLIAPSLLGPLNRLWIRLGEALHRFTSVVALWILLFFVITPIGLILRLSGKDILRLRRDPRAQSYWIPRSPPGPAPETMRNQF